ncbi:MAG: hypothetical protein Q7S21_04835 [archaeon]|nr:hypothetical protein [archaeon]
MEEEPVKAIIERIAQECKEAGATEWDAVKVVKHLTEQNTGNKEILRKKTIEILKQLNPKASEVFDSFNTMKVRTSLQEIESFDRGNITKSLLKETSIPRSLAEKISAEVEDKIKDLKIKHLTASLIREMVDVKLLEYGLEEIHKQYTRVGMPVYEVTVKTEQDLFENKQILSEYNLLKVIPQNIGDLHLLHDIHINNLEDFSTKLESFSYNSASESDDFPTALIELSNKLSTTQKFFSNSISLNSANFLLHKSLGGAKEKQLKKNAELFINAFESKQLTFGIHLFQPEFLKQKIAKENAINFGIILLQLLKQKQNFFPVIVIDSKYKLKLLNAESLQKNTKILNSDQNVFIHSNFCTTDSQIITSSTALNLEKIAFESIGKDSTFFQSIQELVQKTMQLSQIKVKQLDKRNYLKQFNFEEAQKELQLIGLFNASQIFLQKKEQDKESTQFCEKIVQTCTNILEKNWTISLPEKNEAIEIFSKANEKNFSIQRNGIETIPANKNSLLNKQLNYFFNAKTRKEIDELLDENISRIVFTNEA